MAKTQKFVSFLPADMVQGGLIDDQDVEIVSARFAMFDYNGKAEASLALRLELKDSDGGVHEHYAGLGKKTTENFTPSDDQCNLVPTGEATALNKGSNFDILLSSIILAGFPESKLAKGIDGLDGTKVHILRKKIERKGGGGGGTMFQRADGQESTALTVTEILSLPGEGKKGGTGAKPKPGAGAKPAPKAKEQDADDEAAAGEGDDEVSELDQELRMHVGVAIADGGLQKSKLVPYVFKNFEGKNKAAATKRVVEAEFLEAGAAAGLWSWDGKTVEAAEE